MLPYPAKYNYWRMVAPFLDAQTSNDYRKALFEQKAGQESFGTEILTVIGK
jgi:hypothetical protein